MLANNTITRNAGGILMTDDTGASHDNVITANSVVRNTELDCGITMPSHSGAGVFHNTVSGNDSSYNGGPGVGIFAPGPGSEAFANVIRQEALDIVIKIPAAAVPAVQIHLNNITDNQVGLMNAGAAQVDATQNWWGCSGGPGANGCASISGPGPVLFTPWLTRPFQV